MAQEFTGLRKQIIELEERMTKLGVRHFPSYKFQYDMCFSPFKDKARQFAESLDKQLATLEWNRRIYGDEVVPEKDPETSIEIGTTVKGNIPVRIDLHKDIVTHIVISGASGSGKTTAICTITNQLTGQVRTTLIDAKDEGLRFVSRVPNAAYFPFSQQRWNLISGQGDQGSYLPFLATQLTRLLALMPVTANAVKAKLLSLCSDRENLPSVSDLCTIFSKLAQKEIRANLLTAARAFEDLATHMGRWADVREGSLGLTSYDLSVIPMKDCPPKFEYFYIALLFKQLTDMASAKGHSKKLHHVVVFDEGRGFFGKEMEPGTASGLVNLPSDIMTKSRSYGTGIIIGTQSITAIQSTVLNNAGTYIFLKTNSDQEAKACCRLLGIDESRYMDFNNLKVGQAYFVSPDNRTPLLINITNSDLGDYPSMDEIALKMKPEWDNWDSQTVFSPTRSTDEQKIDFRELLGEIESIPAESEEEASESDDTPAQNLNTSTPEAPAILDEYFLLLQTCRDNPDLGASALYTAAGLSAGRGTRVKNKLIELGWVEPIQLPSPKGGRPKLTLKLSGKGIGILNERT